MKKLFLLQIFILSTLVTQSLVYAGDARFVGSLSGEDVATRLSLDTLAADDYDLDNDASHESSSSAVQSMIFNGDAERLTMNEYLYKSASTTLVSEDNLKTLIKVLLYKNSDITRVALDEHSISITRNIPAKLFHFISLPTEETLTIISSGNNAHEIATDHPWWSIFSKHEAESDGLIDDITTRIYNMPKPLFTQTLDISTKIKIILEIQSAFDKIRNDPSIL